MNQCTTLAQHAHVLRLVLAVALQAALSCSIIVDTSTRQCSTAADCSAIGLDGALCVDQVCQQALGISAWSCLGEVQLPASGERRVSLAIPVVDVLTTRAPEDLRVRFCPKLDVDCDQPLDGDFHIDAGGHAIFQVEAGFDGYIELMTDSITPALFFVTQPLWRDTVLRSVLPVVSPEGFHGIAEGIGTTLDLDKLGHVYALASDCEGNPAQGVRFEIDRQTPQTARYYMINNVPVASAVHTDASGSGGFLNVESGFTRITGYVSSTGARIGDSGFIVRAGAVSYPLVLPSP